MIAGIASATMASTRNGDFQSIIICIGGAFPLSFVALIFGFGFRAPGLNAIAASIGALVIVSTHWRR